MPTFNKKMYYYTAPDILRASDLSEVWDKINPEYKTILGISLNDEVITAKQQFETFYSGRLLISRDLETLKTSFKIIFYDNIFLLKQIENYKKLCDELSDFENWQNVTKVLSDTNGDSSLITINENLTLNNSANTDANSLMKEDLLKQYMDLDETKTIPANVLSQLKTKTEENGDVRTTSKNKVNTKTASSNNSEDYRAYLTTEIPALRTRFWWKFIVLFQ